MKTKYHSTPFGWLIPALIFFLNACQLDSQKREERILLNQYRVHGQLLYIQHCSNCHQVDGTGLKKLIPPLAGSDYLSNEESQVICGIKYGMEGPIRVNGVTYNFGMPPNQSLTNLEIAEILTYVTTEWGNSASDIVKVNQVVKALKECTN